LESELFLKIKNIIYIEIKAILQIGDI